MNDQPPPGPSYPGDDPNGPQYPSYGQAPRPETPPQPDAQHAYGQHAYGQQPPAQPAYTPHPYAGPTAPKHPSAVTAMVLGIVSVAGVVCYIGPLLGPFAWWLGHKTVKEIDASGGQLSGRSEAHAGRVLGIIGTVLLVLGILAIIGFILLIVATESTY